MVVEHYQVAGTLVTGGFVFPFVLLLSFYALCLRNRTANPKPKFGKDNPYVEEIDAKFERDPLRGFGERGISLHL